MIAVWHSLEENDSGHSQVEDTVMSRRGTINKRADCDEGIGLTTL